LFYLLGFGYFVTLTEEKIGISAGFVILAFLLLGFGGKETVVTLPAVIFVYDYLFLAQTNLRAILARWKFYAMFAVLAVAGSYYLLAKKVVAFVDPNSSLTPFLYFMTQMRVIVKYITLVLLPVRLNLDYDFGVSGSLADPAVIPSFLLIVALCAVGWR